MDEAGVVRVARCQVEGGGSKVKESCGKCGAERESIRETDRLSSRFLGASQIGTTTTRSEALNIRCSQKPSGICLSTNDEQTASM